tara:strand:- start:349 stop:504 length:156 start_codon:yes stop_codon:yes gene_type:complete
MEFLATSTKFYNASNALGLEVVAEQWKRMMNMSELLMEIYNRLDSDKNKEK